MNWNEIQRGPLDTFLRRYTGIVNSAALATAAGELAVTLGAPQGLEDELPMRVPVWRAITQPAEPVNTAYTLVRNAAGSGLVISGYWECVPGDLSVSTIVGAFVQPLSGLALLTIPVPGGLQVRDSRAAPAFWGGPIQFGSGIGPAIAAAWVMRCGMGGAASGASVACRSPEVVVGPGGESGVRITGPTTPNLLVSFTGFVRPLSDQER
jgi:hypothetical protein